MITVTSRRTAYCLIASLGLIIRLIVGMATGGIRHPQLLEYDAIARSLIAGRGFLFPHLAVNYYSFVTPLYSWITAAGYWLFGSILPVMLFQIAAGSLLVFIASLIAERLYPHWIAGAAAGLLVALHPGLIWYSATKAHPLTFDALFFALALWQSLRLVERPTFRRFAVFGLIVGIGTLSRGTIIISLAVTGLWLLTLNLKAWRATIGKLIIAGLCAAVIIAPWTIRNSAIHHRFVFLLTTDAEDFWRGNNPHATGGSYANNGSLVQDSLSAQEKSEMQNQPNEIAQADWFWLKSREFIRANPGAFAQLFFVKLFHFWWFAPQTGVEYPSPWRILYMIYYVIALMLAAIGFRRALKTKGASWHCTSLIVLLVVALSVLQSLYYVEGRHRWGIEALILALSGAGFAAAFDMAQRRWKFETTNQTR